LPITNNTLNFELSQKPKIISITESILTIHLIRSTKEGLRLQNNYRVTSRQHEMMSEILT